MITKGAQQYAQSFFVPFCPSALYTFPMVDTYRRCASIVVLRPALDGAGYEVLLLKKPRKRDRWQLPQGGVEGGESLREAALRELQEEAGVQAEVIGESATIYQYDFPQSFRTFRPDNVRGQRIGFVLARMGRDTPIHVDQKEITEYRWSTINDIARFIRRKEYLDIVRSLVEEGVLRLRSA